MKIALHGLGKMGMQIAEKLAQDGHTVIAHNRSEEPIKQAVTFGAQAAPTKEDVIAAFDGEPITLWLMLPQDVVDEELGVWLGLAPKGSLIIDGGNSDFRRTTQHATRVTEQGMEFVDIGTSGGIMGYDQGFCMMIGGKSEAVASLNPLLDSLAAPHGSYRHFGPHGAGHYVKMVHNAIEYGMMESLAEGYHILREGPYKEIDLAAVGDVWQHGSIIESALNRLAAENLRNNPTFDGVDGYVAETGEARWTLEVAKEAQIPAPAITAAMEVRRASAKGEVNFATKFLADLRHAFGGHDINRTT